MVAEELESTTSDELFGFRIEKPDAADRSFLPADNDSFEALARESILPFSRNMGDNGGAERKHWSFIDVDGVAVIHLIWGSSWMVHSREHVLDINSILNTLFPQATVEIREHRLLFK